MSNSSLDHSRIILLRPLRDTGLQTWTSLPTVNSTETEEQFEPDGVYVSHTLFKTLLFICAVGCFIAFLKVAYKNAFLKSGETKSEDKKPNEKPIPENASHRNSSESIAKLAAVKGQNSRVSFATVPAAVKGQNSRVSIATLPAAVKGQNSRVSFATVPAAVKRQNSRVSIATLPAAVKRQNSNISRNSMASIFSIVIPMEEVKDGKSNQVNAGVYKFLTDIFPGKTSVVDLNALTDDRPISHLEARRAIQPLNELAPASSRQSTQQKTERTGNQKTRKGVKQEGTLASSSRKNRR